jgi:hypothetical protein
MQIDRIALYSTSGQIRVLTFRTGAVNIITGKSRTGKSAIIDIIDYCLGRSTYNVFEGVNRDTVACYAVVLQLDGSQVLLAKAPPRDGAKTQSRVYMDVAQVIELPPLSMLTPNSNDQTVTAYLSRVLGISANTTEPAHTGNAFEATIDHTKFYLFQEQGLIANRKLLFYRQDEQFIPQHIRDTLPYFLGAVHEERLELQQRLREARRHLASISRRLEEALAIVKDRFTQGQALYAEGRGVGIIPETPAPEGPTALLELLRDAATWSPGEQLAESGGDELEQARRAVQAAQNRFSLKLREIREAESYLQNARGFDREADIQASRLRSIEVIDRPGDAEHCPICSSPIQTPPPTVDAIRRSLNRMDKELEGVRQEAPRLTEYLSTLRNELEERRLLLQDARAALDALISQRERVQAVRDVNTRAARVAGRISMYVENIVATDGNAELRKAHEDAQRRFEELLAQLDADEIEDLLSSILRVVSGQMTEWAKTLHLEFAGNPYRFDEKRLTVVADTPDLPIPMDRQGSGENWLGCHLIALLALHQEFIRRKRPVPNFIILDQPSQVYFPSYESYRALEGDQTNLEEVGADVVAVQRMYDFLFDVAEALSPDLQIIVMEHANLSDKRFQAGLVEEPWRGERALIPMNWLATPEQSQ